MEKEGLQNLDEERARIVVERLKLEKIQLENEITGLKKSENFLKEQTGRMNEELEKGYCQLNEWLK